MAIHGCVLFWHVQQRLFSDATNLIYQFLYNHVATAVEVSQGSYVARNSKLVKRKQAHVVIEIYILLTRA